MEYFAAVEMNEPHITTWVDLSNIVSGKKSPRSLYPVWYSFLNFKIKIKKLIQSIHI